MLVTSGLLAASTAARALLDAGVGDARAAHTLPIERFVDPHDAMTASACRPDNPGNARRVQRLDQRDDRADGGEMPGAGEQFGLRF